MPFPRAIPHSDGAGVIDGVGVIDEVGEGVDPARVGHRVWVYGAPSHRAFGTAARYPVGPDALAVDAPDGMPAENGRVTPGCAVAGEQRSVQRDGEQQHRRLDGFNLMTLRGQRDQLTRCQFGT